MGVEETVDINLARGGGGGRPDAAMRDAMARAAMERKTSFMDRAIGNPRVGFQ